MPKAKKPKLKVGDAYLVVARTNLDEIPIQLCQTYHDAKAACDTVTEKEIYRIANKIMGVDDAGLCSIAIIVFLGGKPIDLEIVKHGDNGLLMLAKEPT